MQSGAKIVILDRIAFRYTNVLLRSGNLLHSALRAPDKPCCDRRSLQTIHIRYYIGQFLFAHGLV